MEGEKRKNKVSIWLIILLVGVVLLIVGLVLTKTLGVEKSVPRENIDLSFESKDITMLKFDTGVCEFNINKSDSDKIVVEGRDLPEDKYDVICINNTFEIQYQESWLNIFDRSFFGGTNKAKITVMLPEKEYNSFIFNGGVGKSSVENLKAKYSDIDCGVGKNVFKNLVITGNSDIDIGVGETRFEDCELNANDIDTGVGEVYFSGKILGDTEIDMGIGKVVFDVDGYKNEYDIDYDKGIGKVNIIGSDSVNATNKVKLDLDCGVGEVSFNFK